MSPKTLIVGGGIGGLTTAIALKRIGVPVELAERAEAFAPVGAGITIQANANAILHALSAPLPEEDVVPIGAFQMVNARGRILMKGDPTDIVGVPPSLNVHRADLHRGLLSWCEGVEIHLGRALTGLSQDDDGVTATFSDGTSGRWELVVGVDGIGSAVRQQLGISCETRYSGQTCWRFAMTAPDLVPDITIERWSPGRRCGIIPMAHGRIYVYLVQSAPEGTPGPGSSRPEEMRQRFLGIDDRLDPILERLDDTVPIHHGDLCDLPEISFGEGRVVLLGDAAHGMTPNMGQGAGSAIEDAAALALLLKRGQAIDGLVEALDAMRRERVASLHRMSWRIGKTAHLEGALICWLRDLALQALALLPSERQAMAVWQPGIDLAEALSEALSA